MFVSTNQHSSGDAWGGRRGLLRGIAGLGLAGALAGCTTSGSPATTDDDSGDTTNSGGASGSTTTENAAGGTTAGDDGAAAFDCDGVPTSLEPFESSEIAFSFAFDGPNEADYNVEVAEDAVERQARFYFARDGEASITNWDFNVELSESRNSYGSVSDVLPNGTETFSIDYDGTTVPVRHQTVTDVLDVWVLGLPDGDEFRLVRTSAAVLRGQFDCHDEVRAVATSVIESIRPR